MNETERLKVAVAFCKEAHDSINQKRKYTGEPYWAHPIEVMGIVRSVPHNINMLEAALLHDVVEDTPVTLMEVQRIFGEETAILVEMLTDVSKPEDGNRKTRKNIDLLHTANASPEAKTIKLADLISNTKSIVKYDLDFAKTYLREKDLLMKVLVSGDKVLYDIAYKLMQDSQLELVRQSLK